MKVLGAVLFVIVAAGETLHAQQTEPLDKLAGDFWTWRARYAPFNGDDVPRMERPGGIDRKSTRLNSSHSQISYAVFCLKKKKKKVVTSILSELDCNRTNPVCV